MFMKKTKTKTGRLQAHITPETNNRNVDACDTILSIYNFTTRTRVI